jgi:hypothetical protein
VFLTTVFHAPPNVSAQAVDAAARRLGLVAVSSQNLTLSGGTLFHFRIDNGRRQVVFDLLAEPACGEAAGKMFSTGIQADAGTIKNLPEVHTRSRC